MPRRPNICPICQTEMPEGQSVHEECAEGKEFFEEEGVKRHSCPFCGHFFSGEVNHECAIEAIAEREKEDIAEFAADKGTEGNLSLAVEHFKADIDFEISRLSELMPHPAIIGAKDRRGQRKDQLANIKQNLYKVKSWEDLARLRKKTMVLRHTNPL